LLSFETNLYQVVTITENKRIVARMMKNYRYLLFYLFTIGGFSLLMYFIGSKGEQLEPETLRTILPLTTSGWFQFKIVFGQNLNQPLAKLLLQIITIIIFARIFGFLCKKIGQPSVIGEIVAGIFLGPSILGFLSPGLSGFLFPPESLISLNFLSQIGLILFMFIVGMDIDLKALGKKVPEAFLVSHASIIFPFALGMTLAYFIFKDMGYQNVKFLPFSLFIGVSMSITAFPVLARILQERGLIKTRVGALAISCAAVDDITAWCILAALIAIVKAGSFISSLYTIMLAVAYVFLMLKLVRPFLRRLGEIYTSKEGISKPIVAIFFVTLLLSSFTTEIIGIHALFGAFMAGVIMPANINFRNVLIEKIEDVSLVLLLPIFFVITGLRTEIGLINDPHLWKITFLIIIVAVAGKFAGSAISLKFVGQKWRESLIIGALMNTRGLMEIVVLNIGYDLGVLSPEIFSMMIIMALVTTFMTGPSLNLINVLFPEKKPVEASEKLTEYKYKVLISFGNPKSGKLMLRLFNYFINRTSGNTSITALHLSPSNDLHQHNTEEYETESFEPIIEEANSLGLSLTTIFKASQNIDKEIADVANNGNYDFMLAGVAQSVFEGSFLGRVFGFFTTIMNPGRLFDTITGKEKLFGRTILDDQKRMLIKSIRIPLGIFINNNYSKIETVIIPVYSSSDGFILLYSQRLIENSEIKITIFDPEGIIGQHAEINSIYQSIEKPAINYTKSDYKNNHDKLIFKHHDLMLISLESWDKAIEIKTNWLNDIPSVLIIKP
jgi:Kef-type K+ transport system membrane component KefB